MYCTPNDIIPYARQYATDDGLFGADTNPTEGEVEQFIDDVSALVDVVLEQNNIVVSEGSTLHKALAAFVKDQVGELCKLSNGAGRFGPTGRTGEHYVNMKSAYTLITEDARKFMAEYAAQKGIGPGSRRAAVVMI